MNTKITFFGFDPKSFAPAGSDRSTIFPLYPFSIRRMMASLVRDSTGYPPVVFNLVGKKTDECLRGIQTFVSSGRAFLGSSWTAFSRKVILLSEDPDVLRVAWDAGLTSTTSLDEVEDNLVALGAS